ncbi:MAG: hypothetical protein ACOYKE_09675 [Ferruginibacter sp.]
MKLRISLLMLLFTICATTGYAQFLNLQEKTPVIDNGIEYGYLIKNEQEKSSKGETYSRYEITLYATNKSGCTKLYAMNRNRSDADENNLVTFTCDNANGKRLTAKKGIVQVREFNVTIFKTENGKEVSNDEKIGYIFRNGETIKNNIIVLVPLKERPVMNCEVHYLRDL